MTIRIGSVTYDVERREQTPGGRDEVTYHLYGPRGAHYITYRNVPNPDRMFLVNAKAFTYKAPQVWLTDANGTLEVLR